jgi:hypothetical protein
MGRSRRNHRNVSSRNRRNKSMRRRSGSKRSGSKRMYKGGNYTSASTYGEYVNGSTQDQLSRVFSDGRDSNIIVGAQGQQMTGANSSAPNLDLVQSAGKRQKKGGFLGEVINQAIVPFGILAMQQRYGRKRGNSKRKNRKY